MSSADLGRTTPAVRAIRDGGQRPPLRSRLADNDEPVSSPAERARKFDLMRQILADDAEVRRHVEPWMQHVTRYLGKLPAGTADNG